MCLFQLLVSSFCYFFFVVLVLIVLVVPLSPLQSAPTTLLPRLCSLYFISRLCLLHFFLSLFLGVCAGQLALFTANAFACTCTPTPPSSDDLHSGLPPAHWCCSSLFASHFDICALGVSLYSNCSSLFFFCCSSSLCFSLFLGKWTFRCVCCSPFPFRLTISS